MSYLPQSKFGKCSQCGTSNTNVVKVKKDLFCIPCHQSNKTKVQIQKASTRQKVRSLIGYEREGGILDSTQELILDLDRVVSRYVRLAAMGQDHRCECFTCGSKRNWSKMHCGHYIPRIHLATRWELANLRVQCPICNVQQHGNITEYTTLLEAEHKGITEWLKEQSREVCSPSRDELKQLLFSFQQKLKLVETKLTNHGTKMEHS
jgi:5-methylcytosine-specific restriction endonuclease McrA